VALVIGGAAAEGIGILLLVPLFKSLMPGTAQGALAGPDLTPLLGFLPGTSPAATLAWAVGLFVVVVAMRSAILFVRDMTLARLQVGFVHSLRAALVQALGAAEWSAVTRLRHARLTQVLTGDLDRCGSAAHCILQLFVAGVLVTAHLALAFLLSPPLALFTLLLLIVSVAMIGPLLKRAGDAGSLMRGTSVRLIGDAGRFLGNLKQAIGENRQTAFVTETERTLALQLRTHVGIVRQQSMTRMATGIVGAAVAGAALVAGYGYLGVSAPVLIAFLVLLARLTGPANQLQQNALQIAGSLPSIAAVRGLLSELGRAPRPETPSLAPGTPRFDIRFHDVSFSHGDVADGAAIQPAIDAVRISIEEGEFVGLTGPSGAGKTTFADLVAGLHLPTSGSVVVGGTPLGPPNVPAWRDRLAYVDQDPFFFHGSFAENLFWDRQKRTEAQVWDALACVGAEDLVRRVPGGLDGLMAERGALLSGGERQRLAIARAILRQPRVLILDEATNALDDESEHRLLSGLRRALPKATILLVSHSDSSLNHCDRIIRFETGRLVSDTARTTAAGTPLARNSFF
jgi:ATP-binding cassette subfamily C protein